MPLNIISYKKAIWKGIEGHLKGIVQKLEDSHKFNSICFHTLMEHFQAREALETRREEEQGRLEVNKSKVLSLPCFV